MKKTIKLTESDLTKLVTRVIEESKKSPSKKGIMNMDKVKFNNHINESEDEGNGETIHIPKKYDGVRIELGGDVNPQDIIDMYNELVKEGTPLVDYSEYGSEGMFYNKDGEEIPVDVVLDELNYSINGDEGNPNYGEPLVGKTGRVSDNEFVLLDTGITSFKIIFNPKMNRYEFKNWTKNGSRGGGVLTDKQMSSLLDFLSKHK
jgi:hypothetical protein